MNKPYLLLDSRAGLLPDSLNGKVDYKESMIMLIGSAKECCKAANDETYGNHCVVSTSEGKILWEWFATGKWIPEL